MSKSVEQVRNFTIAGHSGSGKTSLCDLMLFKAGAVDRCGNVEQKNSVSDYTPEEQEKLSSIYACPLHAEWKESSLFFTDTPGYGEFIGEMVAPMAASDFALIVVDGVNGLEVGSGRAWKTSRDKGLPRFILINRLDRERADFKQVLAQIQEVYGKTVCVPFTLPVGKEGEFKSVVNVLTAKDIPEELKSEVESYREMLMDTIAESDEELMMRYLDGEELSEEDISAGLHLAVQSGDLVPVYAGSVTNDVGITELMNGIAGLGPNPLMSRNFKTIDGDIIEPKADGPGLGIVFKLVVDPFIGQMTFMRVISGTFPADADVNNITRNSKERLGSLMLINGKHQDNTSVAGPGMVIAMAKLKNTAINDTLSANSAAKAVAPIKFSCPVMSYAITAVKSGEEEKIGTGLSRISESDPTIHLDRNAETHELILSGMGDQHLAQVLKKLKENNKVEVNFSSPKIPYRETITSQGEGHYRHKKQTGGHGQFAEVYLRIAPKDDGYEFVNAVVGGNIPKNFIPAVEKGVVEAMARGPLAGCLVQNMEVTVYDGKHHPVDSSEMAFKIAARTAFRNAMQNSKPILLEPIQKVRITIPDEYMGDISGDLNQKRGRILGMEIDDGMQVVNADVPLAEMARYATELRSMTQGRGTFEMEFDRYEMVPSNVAQEIIANHEHEQEEE